MRHRALRGLRIVLSLLAAGWLMSSATTAFGYPHGGEPMTVTQPDGSAVEVLVWGDELYARAESPDGYALVVDPKTRWICYAQVAADGDLVSTGIRYLGARASSASVARIARELRAQGVPRGLRHGADKIKQKIRTAQQQLWDGAAGPAAPAPAAPWGGLLFSDQLEAPVVGDIRGLVVLIDFSDRPGTIALSELESAFNGATYGDARGSIRTWSETISYGQVSVSHEIVGYMRAAYPTSHYQYGDDYTASTELMREVFAYIDANVDLTSLAVGGALPSLAVIYAGAVISNGWATALWPHSGCGRYTTSEGVNIRQCYMSNLGTTTPLRLQTHRHELGHAVFRWPDTYDYDGDSQSGGGYAQEADLPCAPFRMWTGWLNVIDIAGTNQTYTLAANGNTCLRYINPANPSEYFIIEYMKKEGWRSRAPDEGLLVWHIDDKGNNSWQDMTPTRHYRLSVEQADGLFHLENNSTSRDGDLFHAGYKTDFNETTVPNSNWWSGAVSGMRLCNVTGLEPNISVTVGCGGGTGGAGGAGGAVDAGSGGTGGRVDAGSGGSGGTGGRVDAGTGGTGGTGGRADAGTGGSGGTGGRVDAGAGGGSGGSGGGGDAGAGGGSGGSGGGTGGRSDGAVADSGAITDAIAATGGSGGAITADSGPVEVAGSGGTPGTGGADAGAGQAVSGGCACSTAAPSDRAGGLMLVAALALVLGRRRRGTRTGR